MRTSAILLAILLAGFAPRAAADSNTWLMVACCAHHWRTGEHRYNEQNYGLALDHRLPWGDDVVVGAYRNSFYRQSSYAAYGWTAWSMEHDGVQIAAKVLLGGISGYGDSDAQRQNYDVLLAPVVTIREPYKHVGLVVLGIPGVLIGLGVELQLP